MELCNVLISGFRTVISDKAQFFTLSSHQRLIQLQKQSHTSVRRRLTASGAPGTGSALPNQSTPIYRDNGVGGAVSTTSSDNQIIVIDK